jgi:electron transport complex protein RnfA
MKEMTMLFSIVFSANVLLRYAFVRSSQSFERPESHSLITVLLMSIASLICTIVTRLILDVVLIPLSIEDLSILVYVLFSAPACELALRMSARYVRIDYEPKDSRRMAYGITIAGPAILFSSYIPDWGRLLIASSAAPFGYVMASTILSAINERVSREEVPSSMRGMPITLVSAGLIALAFMGFDRLFADMVTR